MAPVNVLPLLIQNGAARATSIPLSISVYIYLSTLRIPTSVHSIYSGNPIYIYVYIYVYVYIYIYTHANTHTHTHTNLYADTDIGSVIDLAICTPLFPSAGLSRVRGEEERAQAPERGARPTASHTYLYLYRFGLTPNSPRVHFSTG